MKFFSCAILLFGLATNWLHAQDFPKTVQFPSQDTENNEPIILSGIWLKSALTGKQPTVIAFHGCGGMYSTKKDHLTELNARHQNMATLLHAAGYHVLFVDSFNPRGTRSICSTKYAQRDITTEKRRLDVQGALAWVAHQTEADPYNIALLGWSNGGSSTLNSLNATHKNASTGTLFPKAAVAFYPGCTPYLRAGKAYTLKTPLLVLIGGSDDWTPAAPCVEWANKLKSAPITVRVYPDSYHDFDAPDLAIKLHKEIPNGIHPGEGVTTGSNPVAKEAAYKEMLEFFEHQLR